MNQSDTQYMSVRSFFDYIPSTWKQDVKSIWIRGYSIIRLSRQDFINTPIALDILGVRVLIFWGALEYPDASEVEVTTELDGTPTVDFKVNMKQLTEGAYLIMMHPYDQDVAVDKTKIKNLMDSAAGLFICLLGKNVAYKKKFEYTLYYPSGKYSVDSRVIENPRVFVKPDVSPQAMEYLNNLFISLGDCSSDVMNRYLLALRWYDSASNDMGVDAFLKYWFALETLAMPGTKVEPIVEDLCAIYSIEKKDAIERFQMGRIQGLRAKIVHHGMLPSIHGNLLHYISAVFSDILIYKLNQPQTHRAGDFLDAIDVDVKTYLEIK